MCKLFLEILKNVSFKFLHNFIKRNISQGKIIFFEIDIKFFKGIFWNFLKFLNILKEWYTDLWLVLKTFFFLNFRCLAVLYNMPTKSISNDLLVLEKKVFKNIRISIGP